MAACFIFLSAKVEEQPRKLEHVLKASHLCLHKDEPQVDPKSDVRFFCNPILCSYVISSEAHDCTSEPLHASTLLQI